MPFAPSREDAVSSVIGDILLVSITVTMALGLGGLMMTFEGPEQERPASIDVRFDPGTGGWGTGDEEIQLRHRGGLPLHADVLSLLVDLNGTRTVVAPPTTAPFEDKHLTIGEEWIVLHTLSGGVPVEAMLLRQDTRSTVLAYGATTPFIGQDCSKDATPPTVQTWLQSPPDLSADSVGPATVTVTLADDCSGINATAAPTLHHRVDDGTGPAFQPVPMTAVTQKTFTAQIPEPAGGWNGAIGHTLEYYAAGMTDLSGNRADSAIRQDPVQAGAVYTYLTCPPTLIKGTVGSCLNMQNGDDFGAEGSFQEVGTPSVVTRTLYGTGFVDEVGTLNDANAMGAPDDQYAIIVGDDNRARIKDFGSGTGTIQKVEIFYEGHAEDWSDYQNDKLRLRWRDGGSIQPARVEFQPTQTDSIVSLDITSDLPSWTWSKIATMQVDLEYIDTNRPDGVRIHVDSLWVRVTALTTAYDLEAEAHFASVPPGTHEVELRYRSFVDTFSLQVWDGSAWNTKLPALSANTATAWTVPLSAAEYQGGSPKVRFVDRDTQATAAGQLFIDYVRVKTT